MSLQEFLSRWLHKRLSHNFNWANHRLNKPYHLSLNTIIQNSGIKAYPSIHNNIRRIENAINELVNKNILDGERTETVRKRGGIRTKRTVDAVFNLFPTEEFSKAQMIANKKQKEIKGIDGIQQLQDSLNP